MKAGRWIVVYGWTAGFACGEEASSPPRDLGDLVVEAEQDRVAERVAASDRQTIDREEIERSAARSVPELLSRKLGLRFVSSDGETGGQVQMRGFAENTGARVLVLVDGRPLNRPDMAGVDWDEVAVSEIERIEVWRGAQTARFGDQAVAGVVRIETRQGEKDRTEVEAVGGSDGLMGARWRESFGGVRDRLSVELERRTSDGWRENAGSEISRWSGRWSHRQEGGGRVEGGLWWSEDRQEFPGPLSEERYLKDPRSSIYEESGFGDQYFSERMTWGGDLLWREKEGGEGWSLPLGWTQRQGEWNFGPGYHTDTDLGTWSFSPEWAWRAGSWEGAVGGQLRWDRLDVTSFGEIQRRNRISEAELERGVAGFFARWDQKWNDRWGWMGAVRGDWAEVEASGRHLIFPGDPLLNFERRQSESNLAWQVGVEGEVFKGAKMRLKYDRFYRLPSTDEIASYQGFPLSEPFNDRLGAETGDQLEWGWEWSAGGWSGGLSVYGQWMDGEIAYDYLRNLNVNLEETRRIGVEGEWGYRSEAWEVTGRVGWVDAEFAAGPHAGKRVPLVPEWEMSLRGEWRWSREWRGEVVWRWVDEAVEGNDFDNRGRRLPGHQLTEAGLWYEPQPGLSVFGRVSNLFDERYALLKYSGVWYPGAGRQWQLGIKREF